MTSFSSTHTFTSPTIMVGRPGRAFTHWYNAASKLTLAVTSPCPDEEFLVYKPITRKAALCFDVLFRRLSGPNKI